ncbi:MAG: UDP-N-acetylglucosamine 2-epimerase [Aminobacterium sp.]|uniref:UDP-N-acetylglucosamine 2-epimerase n=1 Tax=unclassified Aminobacterium TaxID=2685012 RepID=UPI001BCBE965|nr:MULTISPECIES: UDP-N-acetylglucosamine 2-epimerase [unclassified Aminobacterium]MEA4878076.1 UDP-N-acetylglucosamine 2-epimerase [Aminobacterium sp.]WMI70583.1 UDP-N-acetylglucosamine 2-epimerase [Aminobacterium sp. MB27-C1]
MKEKKTILFISGTRADYGKLKPLIRGVKQAPSLECKVFVTGMHTLARYGYTVNEFEKDGLSENIHVFMNQIYGEPMDLVLSNTVAGLSRYVHEVTPDMIVVHGDRVEALSGAIVGSLNNILVAHIEGGEISGTIDETIRHSITKLAHLHFVANEQSAQRLVQMGECKKSIYVIGSPDIDIMLSESLPSLEDARQRYEIEYDRYGIFMFHPVTTEIDSLKNQIDGVCQGAEKSGKNFIVVYPNNDPGCDIILDSYKDLQKSSHFRFFPSLRFEFFLTFLKNADFILGNSSSGIHEAPVYGIPTINIGSRQNGRISLPSIINVPAESSAVVQAIDKATEMKNNRIASSMQFGDGQSTKRFVAALSGKSIWETSRQKQFQDLLSWKAGV